MKKTNQILLQNIDTLRQERGLNKMGDFEANIVGVSAGYFSRLKNTPEAFPSIDVLSKLAELFGVSMDVLINIDIRAMGKNSRLIQNFIDKLKTDTIEGKINWIEERTIFTLHKIPMERKIQCPYDVFINSNPAVAKYDEEQEVILQPLVFEGTTPTENSFKSVGYEISLRKRKNNHKQKNSVICYSDLVPETICASIFELVQYIGRDLQDIPIEDETIEAIQGFMKMFRKGI